MDGFVDFVSGGINARQRIACDARRINNMGKFGNLIEVEVRNPSAPGTTPQSVADDVERVARALFDDEWSEDYASAEECRKDASHELKRLIDKGAV